MRGGDGVRTVAIIGAGTIGASWTAYFLSKGLTVSVFDPAADAEDFVRAFIANSALFDASDMISVEKRWRFEPDIASAVAGADFVQENAPERYEIKQDLLRVIDAEAAPDVVIASSSSGLLISRLASFCVQGDRCVIGHPFNPPHLIPLVEVVGGSSASRATINAAIGFYRAIGKVPIELRKEVPGHVANRLQAALWREAIHLLAEDVASVKDIDAAIAHGPGLRWALLGPHAAFHLGGGRGGISGFLKHLGPAIETWWSDLGAPRLTPEIADKLTSGIAEEFAGVDVSELAAERDRLLAQILELKKSARILR
jgi:carnitine 3-dehydrogenase